MIVLADLRQGIADYVGAILIVYLILVFASVLISYLPRVPYSRSLRAVLDFVTETTSPYLNFFRRFIPMVRIGGGGLDLSPTVGIIVLFALLRIVVPLIEG